MALPLFTVAFGTAQLPAPPTFGTDFYVGTMESLAINQGGYDIEYGACCSLSNSPQCKVQTIKAPADVREQGSTNRTRSDSGVSGSVVRDYARGKEMAIMPGKAANSSHAWVCAQYCPLSGSFISMLKLGDGRTGKLDTPKYRGTANVTLPPSIGGASKVVDRWEWTETIAGVVKMANSNFYVDTSVTPAAPWYLHEIIEPFNHPIGEANTSFVGYDPTADLADFFDIDVASIDSCPKSDNCDQEQSDSTLRRWEQFAPTLYDVASRRAAEAAAEAPVLTDPPPPQPNISFVSDFVSNEDGVLVIAQGSSLGPSGDPCCTDSVLGQCQIQLQHYKGERFFDLTNQRERLDNAIAGQTTVDDYASHMSMLINITNGRETCQEYCPIDPRDQMHPLDPFDPFDAVKDLGPTTIGGRPAQHYQWSDVILKVVKMQTTDFYADIRDTKQAVPIFMSTVLTPFGTAPIGSQNHTWTNFTATAPPAAKFEIAGVAECPRSDQCGQQVRQAHRMRTRQLHTFYRHQQATM